MCIRDRGELPVSILVCMIEVITDNLTTLISDQISVITYYKLSGDRARGELPVPILEGMINVITDYLTTLIIDQISMIT